jgi:hypothetical protein
MLVLVLVRATGTDTDDVGGSTTDGPELDWLDGDSDPPNARISTSRPRGIIVAVLSEFGIDWRAQIMKPMATHNNTIWQTINGHPSGVGL